MKKRLICLLVVLLILVISVPSFALFGFGDDQKEEKTELTIWGWGVYPKGLKTIKDDFEEKYPNIKVNIQEIGWGDMNKKLMAAMSGGQGGPDLATVNLGTDVASFASRGGLADLTEAVKPIEDEFTTRAMAGAHYNGKIYCIPADVAPYAMFYRQDIFAEAGIDPQSIETWSDFIDAGKKITKDTNGDGKKDRYMLPWPQKSYELGNWNFDPMMRQAGGNLFDKYGNVVLDKLAINYQVLETMKEITDTGIGMNVKPWSAPWNTAIKQGKVATIMAGGWFMGNIPDIAPNTKGKWRVMEVPSFVPNANGSMGGTGYIIPKGAEHKEAAIKFAKFAAANNDALSKLVKEVGVFPAYKPMYESDFFQQEVEFYGGQKVWVKLAEISEQVLGTFNTTKYSAQALGTESAPVNNELVKILNGKKSVKQGLKDAADKIRQLQSQQ